MYVIANTEHSVGRPDTGVKKYIYIKKILKKILIIDKKIKKYIHLLFLNKNNKINSFY